MRLCFPRLFICLFSMALLGGTQANAQPSARPATSEWNAFMAKLDAAELEFARGRPNDFKVLWSHSADVTLTGALGGKIELGWEKVSSRLDLASSKYAEGTRTRQEISRVIGTKFAYIVQNETIEAKVAGSAEKTMQELRATIVFRREKSGWRIVHRHADLQVTGLTTR